MIASSFIKQCGPKGVCFKFRLTSLLAVAALAISVARADSVAPTNVTTNTYGSGKLYKTSVERQTEGELAAEDLHQASVLTSQLLQHLNRAAQQLGDGQSDSARSEMQKAESLVQVVRGLLPTTVVTTTVRDAQNKEIYREVERIQDDQISIFEGQVAVEVVEPLIEAKKDEAALKGLKLAEADVIRTAVLVDLGFVERKLKRAAELVAKPKEAAEVLALAQTQGIRFYTHKEDSPLVDIQHALRLAERMAREKKYEGAKANLQVAKLTLETYRGLVGPEAGQSITDLQKEIEKVSGDLQGPGVADKIRGMWEKATGWITREAGQAQQTTATKSAGPAKK
jgi:hypothetical protein